ncbi:hypothetical protein KUCAC02_019791 [Chaenocephalus aceratus]|uniref:Uncharacterized protein n=1 Tax=Chaenocephalus aceratus TaxID=36190 RepID=A0ACB9VQH2_CHAAC|nr:hypothetical protein KUCAC02_019791 [Chaenocephalus aceratus]
MDVDKEAMSSKCRRVVSYLMSREKKSNIEDILSDMEIAKARHLDADLPGCLMLLLRHFNEDQAKMFLKVDETCLPSEVDDLPSTPCIVVCAGHFMIAVDQTIVNGSVPNVVDALTLMFAAYYCLNISYPTELGGTLEFLQRCLFKINPDKGTKVERKASKKVNPKRVQSKKGIRESAFRAMKRQLLVKTIRWSQCSRGSTIRMSEVNRDIAGRQSISFADMRADS